MFLFKFQKHSESYADQGTLQGAETQDGTVLLFHEYTVSTSNLSIHNSGFGFYLLFLGCQPPSRGKKNISELLIIFITDYCL